jgi:hypothetical protein
MYLYLLQVYDFVQLPELYYAGSHGMDIMGPAKSCYNSLKAFGTTALDKKVISKDEQLKQINEGIKK